MHEVEVLDGLSERHARQSHVALHDCSTCCSLGRLGVRSLGCPEECIEMGDGGQLFELAGVAIEQKFSWRRVVFAGESL